MTGNHEHKHSKKCPFIVVFGAIGTSDLGDDAYLKAAIDKFTFLHGQAEWRIFSSNPSETEELFGLPSLLGFLRPNPSTKLKILQFCRPFLQMLEVVVWGFFYAKKREVPSWMMTETAQIIYTILKADAIVNFGGGFLNEDYKKAFVSEILFLWLCERANKPVALLAQSIGPFYHEISRKLAINALEKVHTLSLREPDSFVACQEMVLKKPRVELTSDCAVLLPSVSYDQSMRFGQEKGLSDDSIVIGMSVRKWIFPESKDPIKMYEQYLCTMAQVAEQVMEDFDATLFLVPSSTRPDDHAVCIEVKRRIQNNSRVVICGDGTDLSTVRCAVARCSLFISTRLHPLIFSTCTLIPSVAISYTPKVLGYMQLIERPDLVCPIETITKERIVDMCKLLWSRYEDEKEHLRKMRHMLNQKAIHNIELLQDLILHRKF